RLYLESPGRESRLRPSRVLIDCVLAAKAAAMPHFLDWFVPVYLVISILILVGFGACIYYFEPGLQEAHKWRMQRPLVDRGLRKTLMVRDNLAFGGPDV
uniref:Small integral membrane protein 45 n=1 Tax=Cricetulus griseus TaxID=10029 RepID=A0A8C2MMG2_CRIGR